MIPVPLTGDVARWSAWVWMHRNELAAALGRLRPVVGDYAQAALVDPDGLVRRAGNTLLFGRPDGGQQVVAFIEESRTRAENIESAVSGIQAGQLVLSDSLDSLHTVSMVTLGLSALSPTVLGVQFVALNRRLGELQKQMAQLQRKFDAAMIADLKAGIDLLRQGQELLEDDRSSAQGRLSAALPYCIRSMKYFGELLGGELNQARFDRVEVRLLSRHLCVAVAGVASCQVALEQDRFAFGQSGHELDLLRAAVRRVFHESVARDPAPFLLPVLRPHGVTIEFMARLYQEARDAGALDPAADGSVSAWFEEHRRSLLEVRRPWGGWDAGRLMARLREAVAAVEETNRVIGLSRLVDHARESGRKTVALMSELGQKGSGDGLETSPFIAWTFD